jgi:hypothetical protein
MKNRTLQALLLASLFLCPLSASAQRNSTRRAPAEIKSSGLLVLTKDKPGEQRIIVAAKRMNVDRHALELSASAPASPTPDLTITKVGMEYHQVSGDLMHVVVVENQGKVNAAPCTLRFLYGMTWDALESTDISVPAIPAGKSAKITFTPTDKPVHWWLFGIDVDNKLGEANFTNNLYVVEFKD